MLSKNRILVAAAIILLITSLRLYNVENPFSTNGIDEGIHLLQSKMVAEGYNYYDDLNGDQAPLAILVFSLFHGNVMACRYLSITLFLISALFLFLMTRRFGMDVAILSLLIISLDFTLFRESRLASLDLFSASLLTISFYFFMRYLDASSLFHLIPASLLMSLSILSKIIPVFMVAFVFIYFFIIKRKWRDMMVASIFLLIPLLLLLTLFTIPQLVEGIILRQGHRGFDFYSKASILLFIASSFIYLVSLKKWDTKNERILILVAWVLLILVPLMIQGRTSQHHFVYISPPLAILSSLAIREKYEKRKTLLSIFVIFNIFLAMFFVFTAPHDISYDVAGEVENITDKNEYVISGNPIVNVLANRAAPPNLTNLAKYHYPETTLGDIIYWLEKNETRVIVLYYHLSEIKGLKEYLDNSSHWQHYKRIEGRGQILFNGLIPEFSRDVYDIYVKI